MSSVVCLDGFYLLSFYLRRTSSPPAHALNYYAPDLEKKILLNIYTYTSSFYSFIEMLVFFIEKQKGNINLKN
ncbi:MAG: hypothetical protein Q8858_08455 [Bacteroidota bacterium]|nr:hypothetical protein [Bacteroidota bacterium]